MYKRKGIEDPNKFRPRFRTVFRLTIPRTFPDSKKNERYYPRLTKSHRMNRTSERKNVPNYTKAQEAKYID